MSVAALAKKQTNIVAKRGELSKLFADNTKDGAYTFSADQLAEVKRRNDELTTLSTEIDELKAIVGIDEANRKALDDARTPTRYIEHDGTPVAKGGDGASAPDARSIGKVFTDSDTFKGFNKSSSRGPAVLVPGVDLKTLLQTSAGFAPEVTRSGTVVMQPQRQPVLIDTIPMIETSLTGYKYMEETTYTSNAAEVAEGGAYPEAAMVFAERSMDVRKIGTWIPVTDEQFDDEPGMRGLVDSRLTLGLRQRADSQLIVGNGTAPNIKGLSAYATTTTGSPLSTEQGKILTHAKGADPVPDALYKAMTKIRFIGFANPNVLWMNPNDWQDIRLLKTADGLYIWGSPAETGPERIWGLNVTQSPVVPENTSYMFDNSHVLLVYRKGIEFEATNSHEDFFVKGKLAIRAQFRLCLVVFRPLAVASVTGI